MHEALGALPKVANTYSLHKQRKMYKYKHTKNYHRVAHRKIDLGTHARTHLGNGGTAPDSLAHNVHKVLYFCALPRRPCANTHICADIVRERVPCRPRTTCIKHADTQTRAHGHTHIHGITLRTINM